MLSRYPIAQFPFLIILARDWVWEYVPSSLSFGLQFVADWSAWQVLAVLLGRRNSSYNLLGGDLEPVAILRDYLCSNHVCLKFVRRTLTAAVVRSVNDTNCLTNWAHSTLGLELSWKYSCMCWELHVGHGTCGPQYFPRCSIPPSTLSSQCKKLTFYDMLLCKTCLLGSTRKSAKMALRLHFHQQVG